MSQPQKQSPPQLPIQISPFTLHDIPEISQIWTAALPLYPLPSETLQKLLPQPNAHHLVARLDDKIVAFCLSYTSTTTTAHLAVLATTPELQGQGIGSTLLAETLAYYRNKSSNPSNEENKYRIELGSSFPRFFPGVPTDLPLSVLDFFAHRGFQIRPATPRAVDLFLDIRRSFHLEAHEKYLGRAREVGVTFGVLREEGYAECLVGQARNFSYNSAWVDMYHKLHPTDHPSSIMTAFDSEGKQVGWTLMLPPSSDILQENWALPLLCGPRTGLIGCVGIDEEARGSGIGLALVSCAIEDMRERGVEGVFVDWVSMDGYYEKLGFEVWRRYRTGEILL
ncbi:acyl-CoA N-acyltransferase [Aspergillus cavernicola]|uniref:Acyl-CoA N-acyltransferase n=1 Tax=Aspergillus cavernicola TaxID=176166 RepID=A0ABR4HFR8_9EURO